MATGFIRQQRANIESGLGQASFSQRFSNGGEIVMKVRATRWTKQFEDAQYRLEEQARETLRSYIPVLSGRALEQTDEENDKLVGTGEVCVIKAIGTRESAGDPNYDQFLYRGLVMLGSETNRPWAKKGEKKYRSGRRIEYSNPLTKPYWAGEAVEAHKREWVNNVKHIAGGG